MLLTQIMHFKIKDPHALVIWNRHGHKLNSLSLLCCASFRDVRKFKDTKKQFDRVREDMELAQVKNAQAPRNKVHEAEEATQALILSRKAFRHLALDYVLQVKNTYVLTHTRLYYQCCPLGGADTQLLLSPDTKFSTLLNAEKETLGGFKK